MNKNEEKSQVRGKLNEAKSHKTAGTKAPETPYERQLTVKQALDIALQYHQAGKLSAAENIYVQILQTDRNHPVALQLLGIVAHQTGKDDKAIELISQAISIKPNFPEAYNNIGNIHKDKGDLQKALPYYLKAIELHPDFVEAHDNLSQIYLNQKKIDEAIASCQTAIAINPNSSKLHTRLGNAFKEIGDRDQAISCYRKAIEVDPNYLNAHNNLGNALVENGKLEDAISCFQTAISINPNQSEIHNNMGDAYKKFGKLEEAISCYQSALQTTANAAETISKLGDAYAQNKEPELAISSYKAAIANDPAHSDSYNNLGITFSNLGRFDDAISNFRQSISISPDTAETHNNLGSALKWLGMLDEALSSFRQAIELKPDFVEASSNLLLTEQYRPGHNAESLYELHRQWDKKFAQPYKSSWPSHSNDRDPERRIRIGFVSPDLGHHPVGFFIIPLLENLPASEIETVIYADRKPDELTARIRAAADVWNDIAGLPIEALNQKIIDDHIDILFDLSGHSARNRLPLFARKPAPIQITWAGYTGTTGISAIDYLLSDRYSTLENEEPYYSESIIRMPNGWLCYSPPASAPDPGPLPFERNGFITFCTFSNPVKLNTDEISTWSQILLKTPGSKLLIKYTGVTSTQCADFLYSNFENHGVARSRLMLEDGVPHNELLARYNDVDIALDPFPYSGGVTTYEALWMGVPVVTFPGDTFASRHSASHLSTIGHSELVARDVADYVNVAVELANDTDRLKQIRTGLREKMRISPACDGELFARDFATLMRQVWKAWC
jgi:protein O-GlcNAc transferase